MRCEMLLAVAGSGNFLGRSLQIDGKFVLELMVLAGLVGAALSVVAVERDRRLT